MAEMSGTSEGVGLRVRKPRDNLLESFRVFTILAGRSGSAEGCAEEGSSANKGCHPESTG